jgi:hypothetical protein
MTTSSGLRTSATGLLPSWTRRGTAVAVVIPGTPYAALYCAAHLVRGTSLRIPDLRLRPANIEVAACRPTLPRRVLTTTAHPP